MQPQNYQDPQKYNIKRDPEVQEVKNKVTTKQHRPTHIYEKERDTDVHVVKDNVTTDLHRQ